MRPEQQRVKQLLTEAISLLCRNSLQFKEEVTVEGLLGITLDKRDIFLVSINETVQQTLRESAVEVRAEKRNVDNNDDGHTPKKRRRRRGSREGSSSPPPSPVDQTESQPDDEESSDRVNVKLEKNSDASESKQPPEDGRRLNPAHDSTSEQPPDNKSFIKKQQDFPIATSTPGRDCDAGDTSEVRVKEEAQEDDEECFLIDSDSQDASDTSRQSLPPDGSSMGGHSWPTTGGDQSGFNISELDMISAASFQQQFGNLGMLAGTTNNLGNMSWDPSQMPGQGQPSTSASQDGSQRNRRLVCPKCGYVATQTGNLNRHYKTVHLQVKEYWCYFCGKAFGQRQALTRHIATHKANVGGSAPGPSPSSLGPGNHGSSSLK